MSTPPPLPKSRIEALTDGIFAVTMTLLVLDLRLPEAPANPDRMIDALLALVVAEMNVLLEPLERQEFELFRGMLRRVHEHLQQAPAAVPPPAPQAARRTPRAARKKATSRPR